MNSFFIFNINRRYKILALLLCTGFITASPWQAFALPLLINSNKVQETEVVQQQKQSVTGVVKDASGEPIIGTNVREKGTSN